MNTECDAEMNIIVWGTWGHTAPCYWSNNNNIKINNNNNNRLIHHQPETDLLEIERYFKLAQYIENTTERVFDTTEDTYKNINNFTVFEDDVFNSTLSHPVPKTYSHFPESKIFGFQIDLLNISGINAAIDSQKSLIFSEEDDAPLKVTNQSINYILSFSLPLVFIALLTVIIILLRVRIMKMLRATCLNSDNRVHPEPETRLFEPGRVLLQDKDGSKAESLFTPGPENRVKITDISD